MSLPAETYELRCPHCDHQELLEPYEVMTRLIDAKRLKRSADVDWPIAAELFRDLATGFPCEECDRSGLKFGVAEIDDEEWGMARKCNRCQKIIPAERLEAFPDSTLCVACQQASDNGQESDDREFCPKCGSVMNMRQTTRRGLAQYKMQCSSGCR